jgi:hypothetical protein
MAPAPSASVPAALPLPIRLTNWLGRGLARFGVKSALASDSILSAAQRNLKSDAGIDDDLTEALRVLVDSFNRDVTLTPFGRFAVGAFLQGIVEKRIALALRFRAEPSLAERAVRRPIFVAGLPRTGTTLLHNLLSQAPQARALRTWELTASPRQLLHPNLMPTKPSWLVSRILRWVNDSTPGLKQVHPIAAENDEECTLLLMNSLTNVGFQLLAPLTHYDQWMRQLSPARLKGVYELHRRQLQVLASDRPMGHWLLKAPVHLDALPELFAVYPDAQVILTERNPDQAVTSSCSLFAVARGLIVENLDRRTLGPEVGELLGRAVERAAAIREQYADRIFTVRYDDLTARPLETVADLYRRLDRPQDPAMDDAMRRWLQANPQHKHGVHRYAPADFGFEPDAWRARYGEAFADLFCDKHCNLHPA